MYDRCQYCHQGYIIGGLAACASWHQVGFAKTSLLYAVPLVCDWTPFRGEQVMCAHRSQGRATSGACTIDVSIVIRDILLAASPHVHRGIRLASLRLPCCTLCPWCVTGPRSEESRLCALTAWLACRGHPLARVTLPDGRENQAIRYDPCRTLAACW